MACSVHCFPYRMLMMLYNPGYRPAPGKTGRSLDNFVISNSLPTLVTEDDSAFDLNRGQVMQFATAEKSSPAYAECAASAGFADELKLVKEKISVRDFAGALAAIPLEMVDALTLSGSADHIHERVRAYHEAGVHIAQALALPHRAFTTLFMRVTWREHHFQSFHSPIF